MLGPDRTGWRWLALIRMRHNTWPNIIALVWMGGFPLDRIAYSSGSVLQVVSCETTGISQKCD